MKSTLYSMRMAASNREMGYSRTLVELGLARGVATSVALYSKETGVRAILHGDDLIMSSISEHLGPDEGDSKDSVVLTHVLTWGGEDFRNEAGPMHLDVILRGMGLEDAKPVATIGAKQAKGEASGLSLGRCARELPPRKSDTWSRECAGGCRHFVRAIG